MKQVLSRRLLERLGACEIGIDFVCENMLEGLDIGFIKSLDISLVSPQYSRLVDYFQDGDFTIIKDTDTQLHYTKSGHWYKMEYSNIGQILSATSSRKSHVDKRYTYTKNGRLTIAVCGDREIQLLYDDFGLVSSVRSGAIEDTILHNYRGQRIRYSRKHHDVLKFRYEYRYDGSTHDLTHVTSDSHNIVHGYDRNGRLIDSVCVLMGGGKNGWISTVTKENRYDSDEKLRSQITSIFKKAGEHAVQTIRYDDPDHNGATSYFCGASLCESRRYESGMLSLTETYGLFPSKTAFDYYANGQLKSVTNLILGNSTQIPFIHTPSSPECDPVNEPLETLKEFLSNSPPRGVL